MAAWQYIGYRNGDGSGVQKGYAYWSNGESIAYYGWYANNYDIRSNIPPADATIEYDVVTYDYDGDIIELMDDWGITPDELY